MSYFHCVLISAVIGAFGSYLLTPADVTLHFATLVTQAALYARLGERTAAVIVSLLG